MKNIFLKTILGVLGTMMMVSSCDLNRVPGNAIPEEEALETVKHVEFWEAGFMAGLRTVQKGVFENLQDVQADQLNASAGFANSMANPYSWDPFIANDEDLASVWQGYYSRLKNINFALARFDKIPTESDDDKEVVTHAKGVGHFCRAYYFFNLAIRFGMPYNASTADQDLSVPLVLNYDKTGMPARATNAAVYNQILNVDIAAAKEYLASKAGFPMSSEITLDAVLALESRVKFYMSDWAGAFEASKALISRGTYPLTASNDGAFKMMWHQGMSTEDILQLHIQRPDEVPNTSNYYAATTTYEKQYGMKNNPNYLPTQWMIDLYEKNDTRRKVYFEQQECIYQGAIYNLTVISKLKGDAEYATLKGTAYNVWGGYVPNGLTNPKVFRIAEQYLIAAESAYMLSDEASATRYLNDLRGSRGIAKVKATGRKLFNEIKDERTRELAYEGFRLWDLRRWNMDMNRHDPQMLSDGTTPFLYPGSGLTLMIPAGHDKFVWGIPSNDIKTNPNISHQQNPGWGVQ